MLDLGKIMLLPRGSYAATETYERLDLVEHNGYSYIALKTVKGIYPSADGVNWQLHSAAGKGGASSWNDLQDRPFYDFTEQAVILPEATYIKGGQGADETIYTDFTLEAGKTYTVIFNGYSAECVAESREVNGFEILKLMHVDNPVGVVGITWYPPSLRALSGSDRVASIDISLLTGNIYTLEILGEVQAVRHIDPKYIKDMYYTEGGGNGAEILPETTSIESNFDPNLNPDTLYSMTIDDQTYLSYTGLLPIKANETYTVRWNGVEYVCTATEVTDNGITACVIGNVGALTGGISTGEPFVLVFFPELMDGVGVNGYVFDGSTTVTLSIRESEGTIHHIPPKYIKDMYYTEGEGVGKTILTVTTVELEPEEQDPDESVAISTGAIYDVLNLEIGKTYTVTWNGVKYKSLCHDLQPITGQPFVVLGDLPELGLSGTEEPYIIMAVPPELVENAGFGAMVADVSGSQPTSVTLSITEDGETIHKIDNKYLDLAWLPVMNKEKRVLIQYDDIVVPSNGGFSYDKTPPFEINVGEKYRIEFNGEVYECEGKEKLVQLTDFYASKLYYIGNACQTKYAGVDEDTGEPFVYHYFNVGEIFDWCRLDIPDFANDTISSFKLEGEVEAPNKMPKEFLPEEVDWTTVKDRPFHIGEGWVVLLPETSYELMDEVAHSFINDVELIPLVHQNEYKVIFNGEEYFCTGKIYGEVLFLGNYWMVSSKAEKTEEPFCIASYNGKSSIVGPDGGGTVTVSIFERGTVEKLNEEALPESITLDSILLSSSTEGSKKRFRITVDDSGTITATEVTA